ncbi:MAG: type III-B CRISPR module RAMP protein Cmr6 [Methanoregula sp.]|nr:type III-B CRISPR module RAMP protein Cmr6 [Methanoregula sp.]
MIMSQACRDALASLWKKTKYHEKTEYALPDTSHASLVRDKYLLVDVEDKEIILVKKGLFDAMRESVGKASSLYNYAFDRFISGLSSSGRSGRFSTAGRLVIGLGSDNVLETGITLHHTYGVPVIPGSALKGLAAHYCDQVWGNSANQKYQLYEEYHEVLFGTDENSGHIIFHDGWITPGSVTTSLVPEIMTPHHKDYYSEKRAPTDFDEPIPISFLAIRGTFLIAVTCDVPGEEGKKWEDLAFRILTDALREWGIGGKTNAGYGRLVVDNAAETGKPENSRVTIAGQLVSPTAPRNPVPMKYQIGNIVEVTREDDPHPKPGKMRSFFRAPDGIGGYFPGEIGTKGNKIKLEIKSTYPEGRYDFVMPGTQPGQPFDKSAASQQKRSFSKKQG